MARCSLRVAAVLLLVLAVLAAPWLPACDAASGFCASKCGVRCGRASGAARGACMRSCGLCCEECNCVPTGAAARGGGNECPCYRDMLTAGPRKRPKCP
ncbi:hypothetical protein ACP4OV_001313 [Aristida adscensionis]